MWDFGDLVNIEEFGEKRDYFEEDRWEVSFYCKDCEAIVETDRKEWKKYIFCCKKCSGTRISIGTAAGLKENYFRKKF